MAKKKAGSLDLLTKRGLIEPSHSKLSIVHQCNLIQLHRSYYYFRPALETPENLKIMGISPIYPKPNLSKASKGHKIYPYLLRNMPIIEPNQVWSTDITYIPMRGGFVYLTAIIDWFSRYVLSFELSNTLDSLFTDFTARTFQKVDHVVFWKLAHWLACKYRCRIKPLMRKWYCALKTEKAKTWIAYGISERGNRVRVELCRLVGSPKGQFRWRNPDINPYIKRIVIRNTITSRYHDVAMAMGRA